MGEAEDLEKAWLVGRGGGKGETSNSCVVAFGYGDDSESYSLPPDWNGENAPLIGMQTSDQPERGAQEPRSRHAGGTGGWDI